MKTLAEELATLVYTCVIVREDGTREQYGFHLGTDLEDAKEHAEEIYRRKLESGCTRVDLLLGEVVGVYAGNAWEIAS